MNVDVLKVMDEDGEAVAVLMRMAGDSLKDASAKISRSVKARAAVAELIEAAEESILEINRLRDAMFRVYATAANGGAVTAAIERMRDAMDEPWSVDRARAALRAAKGEAE